jgi:starch phosphorylase
MREHEGWDLAKAAQEMRGKLVGTKHTILSGAGIVMDWASVEHQLGPTLKYFGTSLEALKPLASKATGEYSGTRLMIALTRVCNGVSKIHVAEELEQHSDSKLTAVTNGVYAKRWAADNWGDVPLALSDGDFWARHSENRRILFDFVREQTGQSLNPDMLTVVWARRMAGYKRPELLVSDLKRLAALAQHPERPVQFLVAGRANPADTVGVELMNRIIATSRNPQLAGRFAYLPRYNPITARLLVRGADVWLNTPVRGYEACGTSGMKASLNGAVQFSTSDGWLDEVKLSTLGWRIPVEHAGAELYERLEEDIAPMFYKRGADGLPHEWIDLMRANVKLIIEQFTATRMLDEYYFKMYAPDAHAN